jgi:hypothetical protein
LTIALSHSRFFSPAPFAESFFCGQETKFAIDDFHTYQMSFKKNFIKHGHGLGAELFLGNSNDLGFKSK